MWQQRACKLLPAASISKTIMCNLYLCNALQLLIMVLCMQLAACTQRSMRVCMYDK